MLFVGCEMLRSGGGRGVPLLGVLRLLTDNSVRGVMGGSSDAGLGSSRAEVLSLSATTSSNSSLVQNFI